MEDHTFVVGQEFPDVKAFRNAIKEAAIAQHFELRIIKSDLIRYFAKCATEGCPWRIRAVKLPNAPTFTIRSLEGTHTSGKNAQNGYHQASVEQVPQKIDWNKFGEAPSTLDEDAQVVRPPKFRRPPGRPEKKRICVEVLNREKHCAL